jgi:para-aminobenzoate synthetase/4-amino-4-deoxychorismate lyase
MRWVPGKGYFLLEEHLLRLLTSAEYFNIACCGAQVIDHLQTLAKSLPATPQRIRLLLHQDGRLQTTCAKLEPTPLSPLKLCLARQPVDSRLTLLYHKTTQRRVYETCLAEAEEADEVVLWNERGEVTECCTANLVVLTSGKLITPALSSGLLPGTYRNFLLKRGILTEQILTADDLSNASHIFLINAVRKWRRAMFCRQ